VAIPTKLELRRAAAYVRSEFRLFFPKVKPQHHPEYRSAVYRVATYAADIREMREQRRKEKGNALGEVLIGTACILIVFLEIVLFWHGLFILTTKP